jgi:imidazolonepropionase-like amidohydrolase
MELMVRAGIPPMEVIGMATRVSAENLGMGSKLGTIAPGKFADIIVVDGNPLRSMRDLNHVVHVVKEGVQYKGPGTTIALPPGSTPKGPILEHTE